MRFHPFGDHIEKPGQIGFESTSSSDGSSEVDEAEPEFRVPQGLEEVKRPKKRKQFEVNGMNGEQVQAAQSTPDGGGSRRKKAKHDASNGKQKLLTSRTPESAMDIDSPSATDVARDWDREPLESNQEHMERETKKKRTKEKLKDGKGRSKNRSTAEQRS